MEIKFGKFLPLLLVLLNFICIVNGTLQSDVTTSSPSNLTPREERIRRMRQRYFTTLSMIRRQMLETLNWDRFPVIQDRDILIRNLDLSVFRMNREHCYAADCRLPDRMDETLWNDPNSNIMNMRFDIIASSSGDVDVLNATMRLYMKEKPVCNCPEDAAQNRLHVKVYQYLRLMKRRNPFPRKRLMDSKIITWRPNTWVKFSVKRAVEDWVTGRRAKNAGFAVAVFDQYEDPINARTVFGNVDCLRGPDMDCSEVHNQRQFNMSTTPSLQIFQTESPRIDRRKREVDSSHAPNILSEKDVTSFESKTKSFPASATYNIIKPRGSVIEHQDKTLS